jgi:hypothetical protein
MCDSEGVCVCVCVCPCLTGAGQDVGKSCVIVTVGGKNIMFDCGMHMGYQDERRFPDFSFISKSGDFTHAIDCVIITHLYVIITPLCVCVSFSILQIPYLPTARDDRRGESIFSQCK